MDKENKTLSIGELISTTAFGKMAKSDKVEHLIKHSVIFSFWKEVVGKRFDKYTKPYKISNSKLYVSAKSPVIAQELSICKNKIMQKLNSYSMPLGIEIKDIIYNYKNYNQQKEKINNEIEDKPFYITLSDIEKQNIDDSLKEKIKAHINKINFLDDKQKETLINKICSTYKAKIIQMK